jgi:hypothetical protein
VNFGGMGGEGGGIIHLGRSMSFIDAASSHIYIPRTSKKLEPAQDNDDLKATLTHASDMLRELRTGLLTPKNYYELYMKVPCPFYRLSYR